MLLPWCAYAQEVDTSQEISIAGFFSLQGSGRQVYNFNPGWRFYRGDVSGAEAAEGLGSLKRQIENIGYNITIDRGDFRATDN